MREPKTSEERTVTPPRPRGRHAGPPQDPDDDPAAGYAPQDQYGWQPPAPPAGYERAPRYSQAPPRPSDIPEPRRPPEPHLSRQMPPPAGYERERAPGYGQQPARPPSPPPGYERSPAYEQPPRQQPAFYPREPEPGPRYEPPWPQQPARLQAPAPKPKPKPGKKPSPKKQQNTRAGCILLLAVAAVIAIVVVVLTSRSGPSASFRARVADYTVIDPADLAVTIKVTNTGKAAGTPDCTVQASDPSGADSGINEGTMSSAVRPGQTVTTVMQVTITHQGAQYVDQATVSCTG